MRQKLINRFNSDPDRYPFIKQFQEIMIAKLTGDLTSKQIKNLILCKFKRPLSSIKINHKELMLLTTQVEPEIYLLAQETAKKVTGNYVSIEQLLHLLLTAFIETYRQEPFKKLPFEHVHKGARFKALQKFQKQFSSHYPYYVRSWEDD
jgi:hypothetical protein